MEITRKYKKRTRAGLSKKKQLLLVLSGLGLTGVAAADNWTIAPQLTARELYSDNVRLAGPGQEEGGFITELSPALALRNNSRRFPFALDYQFQNLFYPDLDEYQNLHLLALDGTMEAMPERGFINFGLDHTPRNVAANGRNPRDNLNFAAGRATVLNYNVSPYWIQPISNRAVAEFHYDFDELRALDNTNAIRDSRRHEGRFLLRNGHHYEDKLLWSFDFDEQRIKQDNTPEVRLRYYLATTQYQFMPQWGFITELGYDDNDVGAGTRGTDVTDVRWGLGLHWKPLRNTTMEFVGGERFYGEAFRAAVRHNGRHVRFNLRYAERPTTFRDIILEQQLFTVTDPFSGLPVINPVTGQPQTQLQDVPTAVNDIVVTKNLNLALGYRARRNDFLLQFNNRQRQYESLNQTEDSHSVTGTWTYFFSPRTQSTVQLQWLYRDQLGGQADDTYYADFIITKHLSRELDLSVGARHLFRDSNIADAEYQENRVMAMLIKTWR